MDDIKDNSQKLDFESIKVAERKTQNRRTLILSLIGNLSFCWSNNESMLIYLIKALLKTDEVSAKIIFGTLNTTRARIDLINRLAVVHIDDEVLAKELKRIIRVFSDCTKIRNDFIHCMFELDGTGAITHTHSLKIQVKKNELTTTTSRDLDDKRITQMAQTVKRLIKLNNDIWAFVPKLEEYMNAKS
ncbi:MAG: hypothetical protein AAGF54_02110 [Pseudomonadota bacterium]